MFAKMDLEKYATLQMYGHGMLIISMQTIGNAASNIDFGFGVSVQNNEYLLVAE